MLLLTSQTGDQSDKTSLHMCANECIYMYAIMIHNIYVQPPFETFQSTRSAHAYFVLHVKYMCRAMGVSLSTCTGQWAYTCTGQRVCPSQHISMCTTTRQHVCPSHFMRACTGQWICPSHYTCIITCTMQWVSPYHYISH